MEQFDAVSSDCSVLSGMTRGVLANSCRSRQDMNSDVSAPAALHIPTPNCWITPKKGILTADYCQAQTLCRHWPIRLCKGIWISLCKSTMTAHFEYRIHPCFSHLKNNSIKLQAAPQDKTKVSVGCAGRCWNALLWAVVEVEGSQEEMGSVNIKTPRWAWGVPELQAGVKYGQIRVNCLHRLIQSPQPPPWSLLDTRYWDGPSCSSLASVLHPMQGNREL